MFINLIQDKDNTCVDIIRELIYGVSALSLEEIKTFFPTVEEGYIENSIKILEKYGDIEAKEWQQQIIYTPRRLNEDFSKTISKRNNILPAVDFLLLSLKSVDDEGYLINEINYIGVGYKPCTLYFDCNRKVYEIYYIPKQDVEYLSSLIKTIDYHEKYVTEPNNPRIVIADSDDYIDNIEIKNVAYFMIYDKDNRQFVMKEGTAYD